MSGAADEVQPDKEIAKLDAMEQAVSTLTMNGSEAVDQGVIDAKAAYAILTKKLYLDYAFDDTSGSAAPTPTTDPQKNGSPDTAVAP